MGDHRVNTGIFVHAVIINPPTAGSYVHCNVEDLTLEKYLAAWGRATQLSPDPESTMVIHISMEQYHALWPLMGEEQVSQWRFFQFVRESQVDLYNVPEFPVVKAQDLMSDEAKAALVLTEESLRRMDWSMFRDKRF